MSSKYKIREQTQLYFVSFATVYWIDLFIRNEYIEVLLDSIRYCQQEKGLQIYAWCIMTSHVHLIIGTIGNKMEDILGDSPSVLSVLSSANIRLCVLVLIVLQRQAGACVSGGRGNVKGQLKEKCKEWIKTKLRDKNLKKMIAYFGLFS